MKSSKKQQRSKAHYFGPRYQAQTYAGTRTQPGERGQPAGRKLARKSGQNALDGKRVGVVSKALEQISKDKRRA